MPSDEDYHSPLDDRSIDIGGRTYQLYWCYQCHRTVRIATGNSPIMCPRCFGQFVYEIEIARSRLVVEFTEFDPSPEARLLEALSLMLDPHVPQTDQRRERFTDIGILPPWRRRIGSNSRVDDMDGWGPSPGILARPRSRSWVILTPNNLPRVNDNNNDNDNDTDNDNDNDNEAEGQVPRGVDPRNYYAGPGPGLNELIEELTQNDRPGPLPAPDSAINALPNVIITKTHLLNDSQSCAVCMEDFKVGGEAKELPCNHIFHSNCIVPWLRLHNSCPICRNKIPVPTVTTHGSSESSDGGFDSSVDSRGRRRRRCLRWRRLANIWPFRARYRPLGSNGVANVNTSHQESRVNSCTIL